MRNELEDGRSLAGAYVYVNRHGVLHNGSSGTPEQQIGGPRAGGDSGSRRRRP
ncbi:hypothetical protein [Streptomyces sp. NPDC018693]|uniref:hypothetical protein n=1 Tax=unclassified Streptomyces TaxID=2593676 RepID=UPI00379450AA